MDEDNTIESLQKSLKKKTQVIIQQDKEISDLNWKLIEMDEKIKELRTERDYLQKESEEFYDLWMFERYGEG